MDDRGSETVSYFPTSATQEVMIQMFISINIANVQLSYFFR